MNEPALARAALVKHAGDVVAAVSAVAAAVVTALRTRAQRLLRRAALLEERRATPRERLADHLTATQSPILGERLPITRDDE
ncbi:MAG TPA: hypothetical protein VF618_21735 [Thermoanaerobaculia bacterium]